MTIGIYDHTNAVYYTPDKTLNNKKAPKVLVSSIVDGYQQRAVDGINSLQETFSVAFNNREKAVIDDLVAFLDSMQGVTKFTLTLPDTNNTTRAGERDVKVVCQDYSVSYTYDDFYSLTTELRRVYEA